MISKTVVNVARTVIRRGAWGGKVLAIACLTACAQAALGHSKHTIPFFTPSSNTVQESFVRIINRSDRAGTVTIHAVDDTGARFGPLTLEMQAEETVNFNSEELETGSERKGLGAGVGYGEGNWRLELDTDLDIQPMGYIRTQNGFVTTIHDVVEDGIGALHHVVFFNPASNVSQRSLLRIVSASDMDTDVVIEGRDDRGRAAREGDVRFSLRARSVRTISAWELENGGEDLEGRFGDGSGKWQLFISANYPIHVMNLMESGDGNLSNLSATTDRREPGRYLYTRTGPDRGTITVTGDLERTFCTVNLHFSSTTTGSMSPRIEVHAEDFAPANRSEFERLFADVSFPIRFSRGLFTEGGYRGVYDYRKLWPNVAGLVLSYYDRRGYEYDEKCVVTATFDSASSGSFASYCNECTAVGCEDEYFPPRSWEISGSLQGFSPADHAEFSDNFCGKRLIIRSDDDSSAVNRSYYIDFIDTSVLRTSETLLRSEFCRREAVTWQFEIQ